MATTETTSPVWDDQRLKSPHAQADKRQRVQKMFAAIAPSYDLNNRLHSLGVDQVWRKRAVKLAQLLPTDIVVDVACGTGDLTLQFAKRIDLIQSADTRKHVRSVGAHAAAVVTGVEDVRSPSERAGIPSRFETEPGIAWHPHAIEFHHGPRVLGIDFTFAMLPIAYRKSPDKLFKPRIRYVNGDALSLPLPDQSADVLSIAFGIRNVSDPAAAIKEFHRVLRPGGRLIILEFSLPSNPVLRGLYNFYFRKILPRTATLISRDKTGAYKYLPESVNTFINRQTMMEMMTAAGFKEVTQHPMTFGVCVCYRGIK